MALGLLIEPQFFPPIQFITKFLINRLIVLDDLGQYDKQSYRNRAYILTGNQVERIQVPIKQGKSTSPIKDVKIDYSRNWPREHWVTIQSAYGKTPFFDFYGEEVEKLLKTRYNYLLDLDLAAIQMVLTKLGIDSEITVLSAFEGDEAELVNWRSQIHPKKPEVKDFHFKQKPYMQAFKERFDFVPNLSILDLLFNEGPEGKPILRQSISSSELPG